LGFWDELREFTRKTMIAEGTIDDGDLDLACPAATPEEAVRIIRQAHQAPAPPSADAQ